MIQYKALSIAGFDGSGGAGIQADLKTFSALGCYGMTVLTALPVQNTCGVTSCYEIPSQAIEEQLYTIFKDIIPDSIKIGMLYTEDIINQVANFLKQYAKHIPIVLDPVLFANSGDALLKSSETKNQTLVSDEFIAFTNALKTKLIPIVSLITPNLREAELLTGNTIKDVTNMSTIADQLLALGPEYVLLKGGHLQATHSNDLLTSRNAPPYWLESVRIDTNNTHGTGCTLSAAIAAGLAKGLSMQQACQNAKHYIFHAIKAAKNQSIGKGSGPVHHFYNWWHTDEHFAHFNQLDLDS